jgi:hypothetical protein
VDRRSPERSSAAIASHQPAQPRCREGARLRRLGRAGTRNRRMRRFEPGGSATPPRRLPMCWSECSWRLVSRIAAWPGGPSSSEAAVISTTPRGGLSPARVRLDFQHRRAGRYPCVYSRGVALGGSLASCTSSIRSPRFAAGRQPKAISVISGTGLPSGAVEVFGRSASAVVCGPAL